MNPDTATLRRYGLASLASLAVAVGCTYAGAKLWKAHPVLGGAIGLLLVGPAAAGAVAMVIAPELANQLPR
jgi:hypothetical protein